MKSKKENWIRRKKRVNIKSIVVEDNKNILIDNNSINDNYQ